MIIMHNTNSCRTYFAIKGDFPTEHISNMLGLMPTQAWNIGDLRKDGKNRFDFSFWEYGRRDEYDVIVENQMMKTIQDLIPKIPILQIIRKTYNVTFVLEAVPTAHLKESAPALGVNEEIISFCFKTHTTIDIDLFIEK